MSNKANNKKKLSEQIKNWSPELIKIDDLKSHPRNYLIHTDIQKDHISESIRNHGFYKNIVIAKDNTILAGHGVVESCRDLGLDTVVAFRLDINADSTEALQILTGDNLIFSLADIQYRSLTEILKELSQNDDLLGTGYDDLMLQTLALTTRDKSEMPDINAAAEWADIDDYIPKEDPLKVIVSFSTTDDKKDFFKKLEIDIEASNKTQSIWWPYEEERQDLSSVEFDV